MLVAWPLLATKSLHVGKAFHAESPLGTSLTLLLLGCSVIVPLGSGGSLPLPTVRRPAAVLPWDLGHRTMLGPLLSTSLLEPYDFLSSPGCSACSPGVFYWYTFLTQGKVMETKRFLKVCPLRNEMLYNY